MTMTIEQVSNLYGAVQWSIDQNKLPSDQNHHKQRVWGEGRVLEEIVRATNGLKMRPIACDSNMCVAGNAVVQNGDKFVVYDWQMDAAGTVAATQCMDPDGNTYDIRARARELMGLTDTEAGSLFNGYNSPEEIVETAKAIAASNGYEIDFEL